MKPTHHRKQTGVVGALLIVAALCGCAKVGTPTSEEDAGTEDSTSRPEPVVTGPCELLGTLRLQGIHSPVEWDVLEEEVLVFVTEFGLELRAPGAEGEWRVIASIDGTVGEYPVVVLEERLFWVFGRRGQLTRFDLSDVANPVIQDSTGLDVPGSGIVAAHGSGDRAVTITHVGAGGFDVTTAFNVHDLSDPANVRRTTKDLGPAYQGTSDVLVRGGVAFVASARPSADPVDGRPDGSSVGILALDIAQNPPVEVGYVDLAGTERRLAQLSNLALVGDSLYVASDQGGSGQLHRIDVSDPSTMTATATLELSDGGAGRVAMIAALDQRIYVSSALGLLIVEDSPTDGLQLVGQRTESNYLRRVRPASDGVIWEGPGLASPRDFRRLEVSEDTATTVLGSWPAHGGGEPSDIAAAGDLLWVVGRRGGVSVIDAADPARMRLVSQAGVDDPGPGAVRATSEHVAFGRNGTVSLHRSVSPPELEMLAEWPGKSPLAMDGETLLFAVEGGLAVVPLGSEPYERTNLRVSGPTALAGHSAFAVSSNLYTPTEVTLHSIDLRSTPLRLASTNLYGTEPFTSEVTGAGFGAVAATASHLFLTYLRTSSAANPEAGMVLVAVDVSDPVLPVVVDYVSWGYGQGPLVAGPRDSTVIGPGEDGEIAVLEVVEGKLHELTRFAGFSTRYNSLMARSGDRLFVTGADGTVTAFGIGCVGVDVAY